MEKIKNTQNILLDGFYLLFFLEVNVFIFWNQAEKRAKVLKNYYEEVT